MQKHRFSIITLVITYVAWHVVDRAKDVATCRDVNTTDVKKKEMNLLETCRKVEKKEKQAYPLKISNIYVHTPPQFQFSRTPAKLSK